MPLNRFDRIFFINLDRRKDRREHTERLLNNLGVDHERIERISAVDSENGSFLYSFTPKIKELMPELYNDHLNRVNAEILSLWERAYVNIDFLAKEPVVTLTDKSFDPAEMSKLRKQDVWAIEELKRLTRKK
jgi:hypothetical protein